MSDICNSACDMTSFLGTWILTLVGFADDVDDLSGLQGEFVCLLRDVPLHTLHLWTICHTKTHTGVSNYRYETQAVASLHSSPQSS